MQKNNPKPLDRGRDNPEPEPTPGSRAIQRDTTEQLAASHGIGDPATAFELTEQSHLPPRGEGSVHNQGKDHGPTLAQVTEPAPDRSTDARDLGPEPGLQSGGTLGPSNDNRESTKR